MSNMREEVSQLDEERMDRIWREVCEFVPDPTCMDYIAGHASGVEIGLRIAPALTVGRYEDYLQSDVWKRTRELALEYYGDKCCLCNSADNLNVHHRTYERKGNERLSDLIVLCRDCHATYHGVDR